MHHTVSRPTQPAVGFGVSTVRVRAKVIAAYVAVGHVVQFDLIRIGGTRTLNIKPNDPASGMVTVTWPTDYGAYFGLPVGVSEEAGVRGDFVMVTLCGVVKILIGGTGSAGQAIRPVGTRSGVRYHGILLEDVSGTGLYDVLFDGLFGFGKYINPLYVGSTGTSVGISTSGSSIESSGGEDSDRQHDGDDLDIPPDAIRIA